MSKEQLQKVMDEFPLLGTEGMYIVRVSSLETQRKELAESVRAFDSIYRWLECIKPIKTINRWHTSYGLKHIAADDGAGYATNGTFIAAALARGYTHVRAYGGVSMSFGMSERSIKAATKRAGIKRRESVHGMG